MDLKRALLDQLGIKLEFSVLLGGVQKTAIGYLA